MTITATTATPCSLESLQANEPLLGTAPRAKVWFALEYPVRWGNKAWEESSIDPAIRQTVDAQLKQAPAARLLLIKQKDRAAHPRFFAAVLGDEPALYKFELDDYASLANLDLAAIAAGAPQYTAQRTDEPLFLVCTNGQRDACCALHGVAVYNTLHRQFGPAVWESSHHGGHRFAANLLAFPNGRSYGRLRTENAISVVEDILDGSIPLDHCRGYTAWDEPAQAAELLLRQQLGQQATGALRLLASEPAGEGRWRLRFAATGGGHALTIERSEGALVHVSCGDEKTAPSISYSVIART